MERKQGNSIQTQSSETWSSQSRTSPDQPAKRVLFYDQLRECGSPSDVLDLAGQYTATHRRVSNCLTRCWESTKKMSEEQRRYELRIMFEHAGFEELLQRTMQDARHMRSEDLAYSLLATVKLGVSQRSRVVQTLLRVCQVTNRRQVVSLLQARPPIRYLSPVSAVQHASVYLICVWRNSYFTFYIYFGVLT